ncbi:hypothetical protein VPHD479_0164 [Vibrio phage D479]
MIYQVHVYNTSRTDSRRINKHVTRISNQNQPRTWIKRLR